MTKTETSRSEPTFTQPEPLVTAKQPHFVFLNQYYPPDLAPTGVMLRDVADEMVARGIRVTILCSRGGYSGAGRSNRNEPPDSSRQVEVIRVPAFRFGRQTVLGKLCDYASFYLFAFFGALTVRGRPTCYVGMTTPPYLGVLARFVSKFRRAWHAHWVMDLYPDVMVAHGLLKEGSLRARVLRGLSRWGFGGKRNRGTIALGPDMARKLENGHGVEDCAVVPLWSGVDLKENALPESRELRKQRGWENKLVFLYSGNMGLGHSLEDFLALAKWSENRPDLLFAFYGDGKRRQEVKDFRDKNPGVALEMGDYVAEELLTPHLLSADVHLASLKPEWDGCMVPSKVQGIFASGRPLLFVGSETCAIGEWINDAEAGWVVAPGDHEKMRACLDQCLDENLRCHKGERALKFGKDHFHRLHNRAEIVKRLLQVH